MQSNIVRSILPRIHWSAEELAEGAFVVGIGNSTLPRHQPASNVTRVVLEGVNKTVSTVIGVLGDVANEVTRDLLHPSPRDVAFPSDNGGNGGHMALPQSGVPDPASPPATPSEVMSVFKVVFVLLSRNRERLIFVKSINLDNRKKFC